MTFKDWLITQGKSPKTIQNYTGPIDSRLKDLATHLDQGEFSLGDIKTNAAFADICQKFDPTKEILSLNTRGKGMYRRALVMYADGPRHVQLQFEKQYLGMLEWQNQLWVSFGDLPRVLGSYPPVAGRSGWRGWAKRLRS